MFKVDQNNIFVSTDGQNLLGKYQLLSKTANFFSNQFTWMIVFVSLAVGALVLKFVRGRVKACNEQYQEDQKVMVVENTLANEGLNNN